MTNITIWNRRNILTALAASSLGKFWTTTASAQQSSAEPINVGALAERLRSPSAIVRIRIDVAFSILGDQKSVLAGTSTNQNGERRQQISARLCSHSSAQAPSLVSAASSEVEEFDKLAVSSFQQNQPSYRDFLVKIGVDPDGQAGGRIQRSLRDFQALGVSAKADVKTARERSFFGRGAKGDGRHSESASGSPSSRGARIHTSTSSCVSKRTGIAFGFSYGLPTTDQLSIASGIMISTNTPSRKQFPA